MPVTFSPIPGKAALGTLQPLLYGGDYIALKKGKILNCNRGNIPLKRNYEQYYLSLRREALVQINRTNLIYNLYSKENLKYVTCAAENTLSRNLVQTINPANQPYFLYYYSDPKGELFGKTPCGVYNWVNYMEPAFFLPSDSKIKIDNK